MEDKYLSRAKRVSDGEWVVGYIIRYGHTGKEKYYIVPTYASDLYCFLIDKNTICQCTGLKDKNSKMIWENDIVEAWSQGSKATGKVMQRIDGLWFMYPAWQKREFWGLCPNNDRETTVEVIGNIFDNPELLEVQDDD